jgi:hypothetical protein
MPHVIDDTDMLEHATSTPDYDTVQALPLVLPSARRGRSTLRASLRSLFTSIRRVRLYRQQPAVSGMQQFELPMDILARQHPDLYLRCMTGTG